MTDIVRIFNIDKCQIKIHLQKKIILLIKVVDLIGFILSLVCFFFAKLFDSAARFHVMYKIGDNGCLRVIFYFFFHHILWCVVYFFEEYGFLHLLKNYTHTNKRGADILIPFLSFVCNKRLGAK